MKVLLRILITLLIVIWLGAVMFFPAVAQLAFKVLPDAQMAGLVVRSCLLTLHTEGLIVGTLLLLLLSVAGSQVFGRNVLGPVLCVTVMLLLTAFSQRSILPRMEADRLAAGGEIKAVSESDARRVDFNHLHNVSEELEEGVLIAGIGMVVMLCRPAKG